MCENVVLPKMTGAIYRTATRDLDDLVKKGYFGRLEKQVVVLTMF